MIAYIPLISGNPTNLSVLWGFNYYGLIAVAIILIPNIVSAIVDKGSFENKCKNKLLNFCEQIGRYGCMIFIIFNVPFTYFGFWFNNALVVYLGVGGALLLVYVLGWVIFLKERSLAKTLLLSITPTVLFVFCGVTVLSIPLILCSVLFGIGHISVSIKNFG